jgi:uncharacterized membrane protein
MKVVTEETRIVAEKPAYWVPAVLSILHLAIALPLAWILNIWADEASTLYTTENGFLPAFRNALTDEKQAPLYFWILSLWRELSSSIFFARFFSILCSLLAIKVFCDLATRLFERKAAIFISAVFALHPFLIWASLEIRVYSLTILLSVLLIKYFEKGFIDTETSKQGRILYLTISIIALYTSFYIGFLLVGCFVALLIARMWRAAKSYFLMMIVAGIVFLPLLSAVFSQFSSDSKGFHGGYSLAEGFQLIWNFFLNFVLPTEIFTSGDASGVSLVRLWMVRLAVLAAIFLLIRTRKILDEKILAYAAINAVICAFLFLSYLSLGSVYLQVRHSAVLFVPVILLSGLVISEIIKPVRFFVVPVLAVILLASFTYSSFTLYPKLTKRGDWARVAEFIQEREKPGQPIVIFDAFDSLSLPYYYRGRNKIVPDEKHFAWQKKQAPAGSELSQVAETEFIISEIPPEADEVWLLVNEKCLSTKACVPLENFVDSNYTVIEEKEFYLEKVFLLRRISR